MTTHARLLSLITLAFPLALTACGGSGDDSSNDDADTPFGGKFDDPADAPEYCAERACADRLADAMQRDFTLKDAIRWQCGDVPGVTGPASESVDCSQFTADVRSGDMDRAILCHNNSSCQISDVTKWQAGDFAATECVARPAGGADDRGQEYCEYFAIIDPAKINPEAGEGAFTEVQVLGRTTDESNGAPYGFSFDELSGEQLTWLEDEEDPDAVVGACVFTSWHWDVTDPSRNPTKQNIHGVEVNYNNFRMFGRFNNNGAANKLVFDGIKGIAAAATERQEADQPAAAHPYWAACMGMTDCPNTQQDCGGGVEWRVSDPTVATVGTVLAQCGCFAEVGGKKITDPQALANAVIPPKGKYSDGKLLRGFKLGTWAGQDELPAGCRYVEHDEDTARSLPDTQSLVECDITASDLADTSNAGELKEFCREKFGDNVVVHVPLPGSAIKCNPPADAPDYCEGSTPWTIDGVADTITLKTADFPEGSACISSAAGTSESTRGGKQIDDTNAAAE